jgi:hypothetical protein
VDTQSLIGQKFHQLTLVSYAFTAARRVKWFNCRCSCGNMTLKSLKNMKAGHAKSCGCRRIKRYMEISGHQLCQIRRGAKTRNLEFALTPEFLWGLFLKQNRCCALSGLLLTFSKPCTASLDRIDSSKGYTEENVQWLHKDVNRMKMDLNQDYFLDLAGKIASKHCFQAGPELIYRSISAVGIQEQSPAKMPGILPPLICGK